MECVITAQTFEKRSNNTSYELLLNETEPQVHDEKGTITRKTSERERIQA